MERVPVGPREPFDPAEDLLEWLCRQSSRFGSVFSASIYGTRAYVVSTPAYVEHVLLRNWQNYVKGRTTKRIALLLGKGLMVSEGDLWTRQRRMMQPSFQRGAISVFADMMRAVNARLLGAWERAARTGASINVTRDISAAVLEIVLRSIFGKDYAEADAHFAVLSSQPERTLAFADAFRPLAEVVTRVAARRREARVEADDLLGMLMRARDRDSGQCMSDVQLSREVLTLIVAGHETTASVLNWTWWLLSRHPRVELALSAELESLGDDHVPGSDELPKLSYARCVLEEAMRLFPPGWLMTRKALADDRLGDYFVPAGTEIYIAPYLIQRNPELWPDPEQFRPERFMGSEPAQRMAHLPFSLGPRNCIGEFFARIEMQIHLVMIARRLRLRSTIHERPAMIAGVNLLSRHDLVMTALIKSADDVGQADVARQLNA